MVDLSSALAAMALSRSLRGDIRSRSCIALSVSSSYDGKGGCSLDRLHSLHWCHRLVCICIYDTVVLV